MSVNNRDNEDLIDTDIVNNREWISAYMTASAVPRLARAQFWKPGGMSFNFTKA